MAKQDIFGTAFQHYFKHKSGELMVHSDEMETDWMDVGYFFRSWKEMPRMEQRALELARGRVLDVGSGVGSHCLELQQRGLEVVSLEVSAGGCEVQKSRGIENVVHSSIQDYDGEPFDTLLMMMNGIGIPGKLDLLSPFLLSLKPLLKKGGQILFDSSDLIYLFQEDDGSVWIDLNGSYYGEVHFQPEFQGEMGEKFPWLYVDEAKIEQAAALAGFRYEKIMDGEHYDYLGRLTLE